MVGKLWLAYSRHTPWSHSTFFVTLVPFHFFITLDPLTNDRPGLHLPPVSTVSAQHGLVEKLGDLQYLLETIGSGLGDHLVTIELHVNLWVAAGG